MSEMVDRVARAIKGEIAAEMLETGCVSRSFHEGIARATIEAMREPTAAMLAAGGGVEYGPTDAETTWRAMIDAALGEP